MGAVMVMGCVVQLEKQRGGDTEGKWPSCPESWVMSGVAAARFHRGWWTTLEMEIVVK